jgi:hypothetical protein
LKQPSALYVYYGLTQRGDLGLFAASAFNQGQTIFVNHSEAFYEPKLSFEEIAAAGLDVHHHCLQVGANAYCFATGEFDDFMNHSCAPSCGLRLTKDGAEIVAITDISSGMELTYDYSTYNQTPAAPLSCDCNSLQCRGLIGNFSDLPEAMRSKYIALDVVGSYLRERASS